VHEYGEPTTTEELWATGLVDIDNPDQVHGTRVIVGSTVHVDFSVIF
jgi:hypothetical protein